MVDGENIRNFNIRNLREQICIVSQVRTTKSLKLNKWIISRSPYSSTVLSVSFVFILKFSDISEVENYSFSYFLPSTFFFILGENIRYGLDRTPSHEEVVRVAQMANIHSFILSLPNVSLSFEFFKKNTASRLIRR